MQSKIDEMTGQVIGGVMIEDRGRSRTARRVIRSPIFNYMRLYIVIV